MLEKGLVQLYTGDGKGKMTSEAGWSICIAIALLVLLIAMKFSTLTTPYHWDELGAYVTPAKNLAQEGLKNVVIGFRPSPAFFGHPPLLYVSLALTYTIFGFSIVVSHAYVLFWSFLGLFYTYHLGRFLFTRTAGIFAALFLFFTPLYFSQSGMVLGEIPITALGVMAVYYVVQARLLPCLLCSIAAVLMKETAIAIAVPIALYAVLCQRDRYGSRWKLLLFGLPVIVLGSFYLWQKAATGQWVCNPYFNAHPMGSLDFNHIISKGMWVVSFMCLHQNRVVWLLLILLYLLIVGKHAWKKEYILFGLIGLFFAGAFSVIYFGQRYILAVLPYLAVVSAGAMTVILQRRFSQIIVGTFIIILSMSVWREHESGYGNFDYDMQYTDMVSIHQQCCRYLEENYPDARIGASWPMRYHLSQPWQGYVTRPLRIVKPQDDSDFIIFGDSAQRVSVPEDFILEKRFEQNKKVLSLYRRRTVQPVDP